jgi:hypothetical protein
VATRKNVLGIRPLNRRVISMSTYFDVKSVCGATSAPIDMYDLELNPHGVICCDNCKSIVLCRKAWDFLYKENK